MQELDALRAQLVQTEEELNLQSFGIYKPRYDLCALTITAHA